jgi:hypothetical protein
MNGSNVILITIGSTRQLLFAATTTATFVIIMIITAIYTSSYSAEHTSSIAATSAANRYAWPSWLARNNQQHDTTASDRLFTQLKPVYARLGENNLLLRQVLAQQMQLTSSIQNCALTNDDSTQRMTKFVSDSEAMNSLLKATLVSTNDVYSALFALASATAVGSTPAATTCKAAADEQ